MYTTQMYRMSVNKYTLNRVGQGSTLPNGDIGSNTELMTSSECLNLQKNSGSIPRNACVACET